VDSRNPRGAGDYWRMATGADDMSERDWQDVALVIVAIFALVVIFKNRG